MYVCGVTVYDLCHIGHARSAIVFDVLVRYLRGRGFEVTYVRNFTDVDDKIIERANQAGKDTDVIAREYIDAFYEDMGRLGVLKADHEPRATEHVKGMIEMISTLLDRGVAYVAGKDVYFSVEKYQGYGKLSGRKLEDMKAGSRIAVDKKKRHPMDFALWKEAKPGEPFWPSPWGEGRPGWHLECSVMSNHYLGSTFDIHGGGKDLLFPHHENERAQSISANGGEFARYWVHNGFVTVDSEKMSKSLGNFLTIRDALEQYHPEILRLFLLSKHYRTPIDFSKDVVSALQAGLVRIYRTLQKLEGLIGRPGTLQGDRDFLAGNEGHPFFGEFVRLMDDDFNTAGAVGLIFEKVRTLNRAMEDAGEGMNGPLERALNEGREQLLLVAGILGFLQESPEDFFNGLVDPGQEPEPEEIRKMVNERRAARVEKDWARADAIRDRLMEKGVILEDGPQGTTWRLDV